jgi:hypothetical protein
MDPVTLIVTALAAGAVLGLTDTSSAAVKDAYAWLKALAAKRLAGRTDGALLLARHAEAPAAWEGSLNTELAAAGADRDRDLIGAAQALMKVADEAGFRRGKYNVYVRDSQGAQIGDYNIQHNIFGVPPAS